MEEKKLHFLTNGRLTTLQVIEDLHQLFINVN